MMSLEFRRPGLCVELQGKSELQVDLCRDSTWGVHVMHSLSDNMGVPDVVGVGDIQPTTGE